MRNQWKKLLQFSDSSNYEFSETPRKVNFCRCRISKFIFPKVTKFPLYIFSLCPCKRREKEKEIHNLNVQEQQQQKTRKTNYQNRESSWLRGSNCIPGRGRAIAEIVRCVWTGEELTASNSVVGYATYRRDGNNREHRTNRNRMRRMRVRISRTRATFRSRSWRRTTRLNLGIGGFQFNIKGERSASASRDVSWIIRRAGERRGER